MQLVNLFVRRYEVVAMTPNPRAPASFILAVEGDEDPDGILRSVEKPSGEATKIHVESMAIPPETPVGLFFVEHYRAARETQSEENKELLKA